MSNKDNLITKNLETWTSAINVKSSAGRGSGKAHQFYGIEKLRELILELAMRGLIVPQHPEDESATKLLKNIAVEKAERSKKGLLEKSKPLPLNPTEYRYKIPASWKWVRFGEIALHNAGKTLDGGRNFGELRDYITTSNLYWGYFDLSNIRQMPIQEEELAKCTATKGDLLICEGGEAGRAAVWTEDRNICFQNHVHRARFFGSIDSRFGYRFFEKLNLSGELDNYRKGVGISSMSGKALASIAFPLPPLAEQHRIVAKIDELMALCDRLDLKQEDGLRTHQTLVRTLLGALTTASGRTSFSEAWERIEFNFDTLFTSQTSINELRNAILQLAVTGKLIPQDSSDEPASELLKKIGLEKAKLIKAGSLKKQKALPPVTDTEKAYQIPDSWEWIRLNDAFDIRDGTHDSPDDAIGDDTYPLVTSKDFVDGGIDFDGAKKISGQDHFKIRERSLVEVGDVLFSMIGGNIGNQVVVRDARPFSVKNVALFKYYSRELTAPKFLKVYSEELAIELQQKASGGAQPFISLGALRMLPLALPPIREQLRIADKVGELTELFDKLKEKLNAAQTLQLKLANSLVHEAIS